MEIQEHVSTKYRPAPELPPSAIAPERQAFSQSVGFVGLMLITIRLVALAFNNRYFGATSWGFFLYVLGLSALVFHAFADREYQIRRMYGVLSILVGVLGIVLFIVGVSLWYRVDQAGNLVSNLARQRLVTTLMTLGTPLLFASPLLALGSLRQEDDSRPRKLIGLFLVLAGLAYFLGALITSIVVARFLPIGGFFLLLVGLLHLVCFLAAQGYGCNRAYQIGLLMGIIGSAMVGVAAVWSFFAPSFLVPNGLLLIVVGLLTLAVSLSTCCDWPIVVLTKRELGAYFHSPIAYIVLFAMVLVSGILFYLFLFEMAPSQGRPQGGAFEPILVGYFAGILHLFVLVVFIPLVTMRLFAEEKRSGSLEMLLTAPVTDAAVVWSKFVAGWLFSLLMWAPSLLFLISLRLFNPLDFEYRPILSFILVVMVTHFSFVAMGLFFSSMTSNQIVAAILTFAGMLGHLFFLFAQAFTAQESAFREFFRFAAFYTLWRDALAGNVIPRALFFHLTTGLIFLFLTQVVLASRKWK